MIGLHAIRPTEPSIWAWLSVVGMHNRYLRGQDDHLYEVRRGTPPFPIGHERHPFFRPWSTLPAYASALPLCGTRPRTTSRAPRLHAATYGTHCLSCHDAAARRNITASSLYHVTRDDPWHNIRWWELDRDTARNFPDPVSGL